MRLKMTLCVLLCLVFVLASASIAFGFPSFSYYTGTVKYSDGSPVQSGTVQGFLNGQPVAKAFANITNGSYTVGVGGDTSTNKNQPVTFEVTINGTIYQAATDPQVVNWVGEMDQMTVNLTVGIAKPPADPSAAPPPGVFQDNVEVELISSADADIYYTTDGNSPNESSSKYTTPITLTQTTTIKAKAYKNGLWSGEKSFEYIINVTPPADPVADPPSGHQFQDSGQVALSCTIDGAEIYYTLDNTTPDLGSFQYESPITITQDTVIKARAYKNGAWSAENTFEYTVAYTAPQTPTASPAPGDFKDSVDVTLSCATGGADIYYTLDGNSPDQNSAKYSGSIHLTETTTIKARAYKNNVGSDEATFVYTKVQEPVRDVEVTLDNSDAVNSTRPLGISAKAFENSEAAEVSWTVTVKNEQGETSGQPLTGTGATFTGTWQPTEQEIPGNLPVTREYKLEVKADFAGDSVEEIRDITLANYSIVIKDPKLNGNVIEATLEDLDEGGGTVDCIFLLEKDGAPVDVGVVQAASGGTISYSLPSGLASGSYSVTVFVWNLGDGEGNGFMTLANPVTLSVNI